MGASYLDYILVDGFIAPPGDERWYTEKLIRLPWCYQINDRRRLRPGAAQRKAFGLPEEATVLCCFNGNSKITPEVFGIWMRLLKEIPECLLWLRGWTPTADANLRHAASACGVDPSRLIFADRCDYETHLSRYSVVDLALDTTPFVSHTTASDALWMGCPLITFAGASNTARVAGSLLRAAGLPELVTFSLQEYGELARKFAANRGALRRLRERIEGTRLTNRLFNSAAVTRQIERAYETAWDIFESGGPPRDFDVPDPDGAAAPPVVDAS
jgi:protein O-GlcNAc transferase